MSAGELLLEVRTEEIPARMLPGAAKELASRLFEELVARDLMPGEVEAGYTPRRLWLILKGLPAKERDRTVTEVGPPAAAAFDSESRPTAAAIGFARKFGVEADALRRKVFTRKDTVDKVKAEGDRVYLEMTYAGRATVEILAELIPAVLRGLGWAKTMRWGAGVGPWVRPVHGVVALFGGEVVPFALFDVESGAVSAGHPTLAPASFPVGGAEEWKRRLASLRIEPAPERRLERLRAEMVRRAEAAGGRLVDDPDLLAKLAAICEIPGVMEGAFDPELLELPREVLATSLRDHQSALTVEREGALLPVFLTVMDRPDDPAGRVRAGNEWVVAARLADARFFWRKDRATPLAERTDALAGLGFHQKLGTYADKRGRLLSLCRQVGESLGLDTARRADLDRAADLGKADLTTDMVREFTSLQGVMGGIYAREEGLGEEVWTALYDQYAPAGAADALPRGEVGRILSLADRLDTLVGFFAIGSVPTGSRDPFGLRRAALGVVRILPELGARLDLAGLVRAAHHGYTHPLSNGPEKTWELLRPFFEDRLRFLLETEGFAYDEIEAALQAEGETFGDLGRLRAKVAALRQARARREFLSVVLAAKRIANITKDQPANGAGFEELDLPAERRLRQAFLAFESERSEALAQGDFGAALDAVARLSPSLESFFDEVLVLDPDPTKRSQRVALLRSIGSSIARLADLSRIVVDKAEYR